MRLTQIKLSGFKSFVDPTQFALPGRLVGVVGPNGCGKSNIIDAARWVLGESKASELRGESMQDVIFNGSGHRKPAGRASVELVFDNTPGGDHGRQAAGPWGQYAEIAVKRVLTRDGTSSYLINNQAVRRRDIQDIFLGTGLGPRAYAIIGQGMISRIIEARPDELRVFLEEAAGISKYKERRRETENRLADTRENLTRVEDILRELTTNLDRLERQAVVAQRYRDLETEVAGKQKLLWLMRSVEAEALAVRHGAEGDAAQLALDARTADLRRSELELEQARRVHEDAGAMVHAAQGAYYEAASRVSAIEAEIRIVVESRGRLQTQLAQVAAQSGHWEGEARRLAAACDDARGALAASVTAIDDAEAALAAETPVLPDVEGRARAAVVAADALRAEVSDVRRDLEVERTHERNADRQQQALAGRRARLADEQRRLDVPDATKLDALRAELATLAGRLADRRRELEGAEAALPALQAARATAHQERDRESAESARVDARLAALKHLQERVQANGKLQPWLDRHDLGRLPRLWQNLRVRPGWETAVESVLRERVGALEVARLDEALRLVDDMPPAKLALYAAGDDARDPPDASKATLADAGLVPLANLIELRDPAQRRALGEWLADAFAADDAADAFARRDRLPVGASFVLQSGHRIGRSGLQLYAPDSEQSGLLARQHEIDDLALRSRAQALLSGEARGNAANADAALNAATTALATSRQAVATTTGELHARQLAVQRLEQDVDQARQRGERIAAELAHLADDDARETAARVAARANVERLDAALADLQARFDAARGTADASRVAVDAARNRFAERQRAVHETRYERKAIEARLAGLEAQAQAADEQRLRVREQEARLAAELAGLSDTDARASLQEAVGARAGAERRLADARAELDAIGARIRAADEARLVTERDLEPLRVRIGEAQLKLQAARIAQQQFDAQLDEAGADRAALAAVLAGDDGAKLKAPTLQAEVQRLQQTIAGLGAVNLAALDELATARERKTFLDAQSADLGEAIGTLEDAIRRIDRETRALLQETFDAINIHFGKLFPALFGGGEARLVMTGDEILDAGVQVMAQPPGKKNSSIHLLSGGEKALTATALVFAMFQLNPAPFCLLDEVDAPLDDANTERFCNLVKTMSAQTQFLFISHNKIAMEMAQQLIGVTMQEQGVSRVVAVDLESAIGFANERIEEAA